MAENEPTPFRCTCPSGQEVWGPGRMTLRQRSAVASASRPPTRMPDGEVQRFFDFEGLHAELVIQFLTAPDAGWTLTDQGGVPLDRTREGIEGCIDPRTQMDLMHAGIELMKRFYPEYFQPVPGVPPLDPATAGESPGGPESPPKTPTKEKAGSDSSRKKNPSNAATTT